MSIYILALISLNSVLSFSMSVCFAGQLMPNPSSSLGLGIYAKSVNRKGREKTQHPVPRGSVPGKVLVSTPTVDISSTKVTKRNQRRAYMIHDLVSQASVVLQQVILLCSARDSNLLGYRLHLTVSAPFRTFAVFKYYVGQDRKSYQDFSQGLVRDVGEHGPMVFGYHELVHKR